MTKPLAVAKLRAARALAEGAAPTLHLIAEAMGRSPERLMRHAKDEGWVLSPGPGEELQARLHKFIEDLLTSMEEMKSGAALEGAHVEKSHMDAITQMIGNVKKMSDITRSTWSVKEKKTTDEEIAAILARIDDRIIELAHQIAEGMAGTVSDQSGGAGS